MGKNVVREASDAEGAKRMGSKEWFGERRSG